MTTSAPRMNGKLCAAAGLAAVLVACAPLSRVAPAVPGADGIQGVEERVGEISAAAVERLVDATFAEGLEAEQLPGGVFILVQNGRVIFAKGYGVSNVETREPVSPDSTLWRIGSITKVMTAAGVVQLADRGTIRLDRDVNEYLSRVKVPDTYPSEPVTAWHLLTHSAGLDELPGRSAATQESVLPLHEFLSERLVRVRPPGRLVAYSSYGPALAGALIEQVSSLRYEEYLQREVWRPLGMHDTNVTPRDDMPTGYGVREGSIVDEPWEWSHTVPAGMVNSTAADMGRFMNMMLGHHPDGSRVLSEPARRSMLTRQKTMHPHIPGVGLGFMEDRVNGRVIFEHGGDIAGYASLLVLLPEEDAGFFIATHREGAQLRYTLQRKLIDRFFPEPGDVPEATAAPMTHAELSRFAGEYRWNIFCRTCEDPWMPGPVRVTVNDDQTLTVFEKKWRPIGRLLFQEIDGTRQMGFATDSSGAVWQLTMGNTRVLERVGD